MELFIPSEPASAQIMNLLLWLLKVRSQPGGLYVRPVVAVMAPSAGTPIFLLVQLFMRHQYTGALHSKAVQFVSGFSSVTLKG